MEPTETGKREENSDITRACNWALRHSSYARNHRDVYGVVPWAIAIETIKHKIKKRNGWDPNRYENGRNGYVNKIDSWTTTDWLNNLTTCVSARFIVAWEPYSRSYLQDQATSFEWQKPQGWPLPWSTPLKQTTWYSKQYPQWSTKPTHIACVQGHSEPGVLGYTDVIITPEIAQYIPTFYHVTKWWKGKRIVQSADSLKPGKDVEDCENDRAEVFGTGVNPTISSTKIPSEEDKSKQELAAKEILLTQYKDGTKYFAADCERTKMVLEFNLDQLVRDGYHFVYKATGSITTESEIPFEYYKRSWDIYSRRIVHDNEKTAWTQQREWDQPSSSTHSNEIKPSDQKDQENAREKENSYQPTYGERPIITFLRAWGDKSWRVEYRGEWDNERGKHVALRLEQDPPGSHGYKVKPGDQYYLHNLRKGGRDNKAVMWDIEGLVLSNRKEAHFTVHYGNRPAKDFFSTWTSCMEKKADELKQRFTLRRKADELNQRLTRKKGEEESEIIKKLRSKEEVCIEKEDADAQTREEEQQNERLPGTQAVLNEETKRCEICNTTNFANTIQCTQCGALTSRNEIIEEQNETETQQWGIEHLRGDEEDQDEKPENENEPQDEEMPPIASASEENPNNAQPTIGRGEPGNDEGQTAIASASEENPNNAQPTAGRGEPGNDEGLTAIASNATVPRDVKKSKYRKHHRTHLFKDKDGNRKMGQIAWARKKARKMKNKAIKEGFYGYNGKEKGIVTNQHSLKIIRNDEEYGSIEERFNGDSAFRLTKLNEDPPFTGHCARIMDILSMTRAEDLTPESGITRAGEITQRVTHSAMSARQPEEVNLNGPASESSRNRRKRREWRETHRIEGAPQRKRARGDAALGIVAEMIQNTENLYMERPIQPDREGNRQHEHRLSAILSCNTDYQRSDYQRVVATLPCFQGFQDDQSHGQIGTSSRAHRSRSPGGRRA